MRKFLGISFFLLALVWVESSLAQSVEFTKENFPDKKDELKDVLKNLDLADEFYRLGKPGFKSALDLYLRIYQFNPKNAELNWKIGNCYLNSVTKELAAPYLEACYKLDPKHDPRILYQLARAFHLNMQFDAAIDTYLKYKNSLSPLELNEELKDITKKIEECKNGIELVANPVRVIVNNLGPNINTEFPEYTPTISADEQTIFYTARRPETTGGEKDPEDEEYFEDIMWSTKDGSGNWIQARNAGLNINSKEHDSNINLSPDAQKLVMYKGDNGGDILLCVLRGNEWSKPDRFEKIINTKYHESGACFSFDERTLYFCSDRPDLSIGGRDVLFTKMGKGKNWTEPQNIGTVINTPYDDDGVFMHPDGKTMYFSSKGHKTMGGYDIFRTVYSDSLGQWSDPVNIGFPINTPDDDIYFVVSANQKRGYFTSVKKDGHGEKDLYMLTFLGPEKKMLLSNEHNLLAGIAAPTIEKQVAPPVAITSNLTILKGKVYDAKTGKPLEGVLEITDNKTGEVIATFLSNAETGKYLITLPSGRNYGIAVTCEGYFFHSENVEIPYSAEYQEITRDFPLRRPEVGESFVLKNVFFDFDKATLRPESRYEIERLRDILLKFPRMRVELSSHTDSKGSDEYNWRLSAARSKSVVTYLVQKLGIPEDRLEHRGYGETKPIAPNTYPDGSDNPEGRQLNRRTEFKILSIE